MKRLLLSILLLSVLLVGCSKPSTEPITFLEFTETHKLATCENEWKGLIGYDGKMPQLVIDARATEFGDVKIIAYTGEVADISVATYDINGNKIKGIKQSVTLDDTLQYVTLEGGEDVEYLIVEVNDMEYSVKVK